MAKLTLLEMAQRILSNMDSDEVNSITDTIEAAQVAGVIQQTYFDICDEMDLPFNGEVINLQGLADTSKPTHMQIPESVTEIEWIKYNKKQESTDPNAYGDIKYLSPKAFVELVNARDSTDTTNNLVVMYNTNSPLVININTAPTYWTSFDDEYIVFDSYNSDVDSTLQTSKTWCWGYERPEFVIDDATVPDLPEELFTLLLAQAEATCFYNFKQTASPKAEQRERRFRIRAQRNKWRQSKVVDSGPNYGRK